MDVTQGTDLAALHSAITATSAAAFNGVHFEFYREDRKNLPMGDGIGNNPPRAYCLLDLPEMDASDFDPGTDQQAVTARFEAEFIIRAMQPNARLLIRALAGSFAAFLRKQVRWPGVLNGGIHVTGCYKDDFSPELDQFEVWKVEWTQDIWLGTGVDMYLIPAEQTASGSPEIVPGVPALTVRPQEQLFSYVPLVGIPYVSEYQPIAPGI